MNGQWALYQCIMFYSSNNRSPTPILVNTGSSERPWRGSSTLTGLQLSPISRYPHLAIRIPWVPEMRGTTERQRMNDQPLNAEEAAPGQILVKSLVPGPERRAPGDHCGTRAFLLWRHTRSHPSAPNKPVSVGSTYAAKPQPIPNS